MVIPKMFRKPVRFERLHFQLRFCGDNHITQRLFFRCFHFLKKIFAWIAINNHNGTKHRQNSIQNKLKNFEENFDGKS